MIGISVAKRDLGAKLGIPRWTVHDLRRTAATFMGELGVPYDVIERILGHRLPGGQKTYNRAELISQMKTALVKLAERYEQVAGENVMPMAQAG